MTTEKKISVVISSLRPDRLEETIDSTAMHSDLIEVVVVSPYKPKPRDFVRHIPVPAPGEAGELTFTQKFNLGARGAEKEFVVYSNDDFHFRSGWAPALIQHMEKESERPYLAAFDMAVKKRVHTRYTAFGLLYANIGCIRKADLKAIGGYLFDEHLFMYTSDIDVSLRVWNSGGKVGICKEVVMDSDRDVDQVTMSQTSVFYNGAKNKEKEPLKRTYRDAWFAHDHAVFFRTWFPKYFWLFLKNYPRLRTLLTNDDGVLPQKWYRAGLLKIMLLPVLSRFLHPKHFLKQNNKVGFVWKHWVRVVNRRWGKFTYESPYFSHQVAKNTFFKSKGA